MLLIVFPKCFQAQPDFQYGKHQLRQLWLGKFKITDPTSSPGKYWLWLSQPPALLVILKGPHSAQNYTNASPK